LILSPTEQSLEIGLNKMDLEIADLEKRLSRPGEKIGFCHNDLQYGNIMISEKDDSINNCMLLSVILTVASQTLAA
jgi:thiamine kinase-like enzyme